MSKLSSGRIVTSNASALLFGCSLYPARGRPGNPKPVDSPGAMIVTASTIRATPTQPSVQHFYIKAQESDVKEIVERIQEKPNDTTYRCSFLPPRSPYEALSRGSLDRALAKFAIELG